MNPRSVKRPKYKCLWQTYPLNNELLNHVVSPIVGEHNTGSPHVKMHLAEDTTARSFKEQNQIREQISAASLITSIKTDGLETAEVCRVSCYL